jgi:hypothetical protein
MTGALVANLPGGGLSAPIVSLTDAWVSAVVDGQGRLILPRNGGHADGAHNGVRAFDHTLNQWSFLTPDSTAYARLGQVATDFHPVYSDGTPASVHSYDGYTYMPNVNRVWSGKGIYWSPGGESTGVGTFEFDLGTNSWVMSGIPDRPGGYSCGSTWDPVTQRVLFITSGGFYAYNPISKVISTLFTQTGYGSVSSTLALDSVGRRVYWIYPHTAAPFVIKKIDLNNLAAKSVSITASGDVSVLGEKAVGLVYDNGKLVAYGKNAANTGGTLYICDPLNPVWARVTTGGVTPPLPSINATFKKFYKHPNGYYHHLSKFGIHRILPDFGTIPASIVVKVAGSYTVEYVSTPPTPPDPPGGGNPLPLNTWTLVPAPPVDTPPTDRVGKHLRVLRDTLRGRFVVTGGDSFGSDAGQPAVRTYDSLTGLTTVLSPTCIPAPGIMPNFPDNVVWVHDTKRDRYLMFKGFYFGSATGWRPTATLTPSATTGTITLTQGAGSNHPFESWMVGKRVVQYSAAGGSTIIAHATITAFTSATVVVATVGLAYASTAAIVSQAWEIEKTVGGKAATVCGRNSMSGDTGVINDDIMFNPQTNKWELKDFPTSPIGLGSDSGGPSHGVYDEATDAVYMLKNGQGLMILHRATNTWEIIPYGAGMVAGAEKTLVTSSGNVAYRAVIAQAGRSIFYYSDSIGHEAFVEFNLDTKVWHGYAAAPTVVTVGEPDNVELPCWYDPISDVVATAISQSLTGDITQMQFLTLATKVTTKRDFAVIPFVQGNQPLRNGYPIWDPNTGAMALFGRVATGVAGVMCWHYRYGP